MPQDLSFYPTSSGTEIDLRDEMRRFLHGDENEIPKGRVGFLRRMRKDSSGNLVPCACVDVLTHEPDLDSLCPYCLGEGFYWDEETIVYYKEIVGGGRRLAGKVKHLEPGELNIPFVNWYMEYFVGPTLEDRIVEVELNAEGEVILPVHRMGIYRIETVEDFRSDRGRIEYFKIATNLQAGKR